MADGDTLKKLSAINSYDSSKIKTKFLFSEWHLKMHHVGSFYHACCCGIFTAPNGKFLLEFHAARKMYEQVRN